jgi:hypothetical protein
MKFIMLETWLLENVRCLLPEESSDKCEIICYKSIKCKQSSILTSIQHTSSPQLSKSKRWKKWFR